jgi:type II secretory pathway pseudopilin PulG
MHVSGQKGATLVEIMAAIGLFAIALTSVLSLVTSTQSMGQRADKAYNAYNLAKNHVESLRTMSFDDLTVADEDEVRIDVSGVPDDEGEYLRSTTVTTPYDGDAELAQVDVEVSYEIKGQVTGDSMKITSVIQDEDA